MRRMAERVRGAAAAADANAESVERAEREVCNELHSLLYYDTHAIVFYYHNHILLPPHIHIISIPHLT